MKPPRTLPNVVYTAGLDDLSQRLFSGKQHLDYPALRAQFLPELAKIGEALIISPRVVLKMSGHSLILPILLDYFQDAAFVLDLLHEGALEFIVWTHAVGSVDSVIMGMPNPVEAKRHPATIAERDLEVAFPNLDISIKHQLIEEFLKRAVSTTADDAESAINVAASLADVGAFGDRLPSSSAFANGPLFRTNIARKTAEDIHETFVILGNEYDLFETDGTWEAITRVAADIHRNTEVIDAVEAVYAQASVPSTRNLLLRGIISPGDLVRVRRHPATQAFRRWLWDAADPGDGGALASDYIKSLDRGLDPADGRWYRNSRILIANLVGEFASRGAALGGAAIGGHIAGLPGAAIGGSAGFLASTAVSLLDPLIPEYFRKPDPRQFTDQVLRPLSRKSS